VGELRLDAVKFTSPIRWGWVLTDGASGAFISSHMMQPDDSSWQFEAFSDLAGYLSWHAAPDTRAQDETRIVGELGEWVGSQVLGPVASAMVQASPVTVRVVALEAAAELLAGPLELAHVGGKPIAGQGVTLVMDTGSAESAVRPVGERLRVLGLFSLPEGRQALNLRRERHSLVQLIKGIASGGKAVDVEVLQYGVTRDRLREILAEDEGWDVVHISGHGSAGQLLLETDAGEPDQVTASELAELLDSARGRLKLVTVSACWSAAVAVTEQRRLLGLPAAADRSTPVARSSGDGASARESLAAELNRRLGCAVLAMRYPVDDEFALALSGKLYALLAGEGQPLPEAVRQALHELAPGPDDAGPGSNAFPPLSLAAPALFGSTAIGLRLAAPDAGPESGESGEPAMPGFPPEPERFVGRTGVMARASAALAVGSGVPGVLLFGMPGGGKTACALELAYGHEHAFDRLVWYKAPEHRTDIAGALTDFAVTLERGLNGPEMASWTADDDNLAAFPSRLDTLLRNRRLLIVIDNADSLLNGDGDWGDERWGEVIDALTQQPDGLTRVILTSRHVPARRHGLRVEAVGTLSVEESLLLARELPNLNALARGQAPGMDRHTARRVARRAFYVAQGHPKMLELADRQAAHPERLAELIEADREAWAAPGGPPQGFFDVDGTAAGAGDYLEVFAAWTDAVSETLTDGERDLFWVLCCLIDPDRIRLVLDVIWPGLWTYLGREGQPPDLDSALAALTARGLVEAAGDDDPCKVQVGIVAAGRRQAGKAFSQAVAAAAGEFWITALRYTSGGSSHGVRTDWQIRALQSAIVYLIEYEDWKGAAAALALSFIESPSRADAATVTALLQQIARRDPSTADLLAMVMQKIDPASVEARVRDSLADAVARGDYREAETLGARLIDIYSATGRLQEALVLADQKIGYCRQAGLGPRTQIFHELQRLQVLLQMGNAHLVLSEIQQLRDRLRNVSDTSGSEETTDRWVADELLLETGRSAARQLSRWADALDFSADLIDSLQARRAPASDIAQAKFSDYDVLLALGAINEALDLLLSCRQVFQDAGDIAMLGKTFGALADVEDERGRTDAAVSLQRDALRYFYLSGDIRDIAVSYHNFGIYLYRASQPALALASHLAAALIEALTGISDRHDPVLHAAINLRQLGSAAVPPSDVAELCRQVGDIPGTGLPGLIATLSPVADTAERALHELIAQARALAAKGGPNLT
jgi:hypothetical protein